MSLSSGGIAQFSAGAGRSAMIKWPTPADVITGGSAPSSNLLSRGGSASAAAGVSQSVAGATGSIQYQNYTPGSPGAINSVDSTKGSTCVMVKNGAVADSARVQFNQGFQELEVEQLGAGILPDPFFRVFRFVVRCVFPLLPGPINQTTVDCGICLAPGGVSTSNGMNQGANRPGIQLGPTDNGVFTLRSRKSFAAGYDFQQNFTYAALGLPTPAETFCTYELRLISADNSGPAKVKAFVNNIQVGPTFSISAADGRVPGPNAGGSGTAGLVPYVHCANVGNYQIYMKWMAMIWSPDEQGNL